MRFALVLAVLAALLIVAAPGVAQAEGFLDFATLGDGDAIRFQRVGWAGEVSPVRIWGAAGVALLAILFVAFPPSRGRA